MNMKVLGADIIEELPTELSNSWELDGFIALPENAELPQFATKLVKGVHEYLQESDHAERAGIDVIVVASGGWESDPKQEPPRKKKDLPLLPDEELALFESSAQRYAESVLRMRRMNLDPVIAAGFVAQHMSSNENGLMVVMGASAALSPTPGMMGYGLAKVATHYLVQTLGLITAEGNSLERRALRTEAQAVPQIHPYMTVVSILPQTIDTPNNRRAMPNGKFHLWTKPVDIAKEIGKWAENPALRPHSGSLVKVFTQPGEESATFELVY
jgi:dihydropteridine reductase